MGDNGSLDEEDSSKEREVKGLERCLGVLRIELDD
jgi:hypothetical protein